MKELDNKERLRDKTQIEAVVKKQQATELKFDFSINPLRGHTLFEINTITNEVKPAEFLDKKTISFEEAKSIQKGTYVSEVVRKKDCVYISALNKESALKRYSEDKGSARLPKAKMKL